jgi:hypothetical protein
MLNISITPMNADDIKASLGSANPPENLNVLLQALWFDAKGDWESAHNIAQDVHTAEGSWVHAYLHRKEGDLANASYWYHRARKPVSVVSLSEEWRNIADALIKYFNH